MISIPKLDNYTASLEPKSGKEALITAARLSTNEFCIMRRSRNGGEEAQSEKRKTVEISSPENLRARIRRRRGVLFLRPKETRREELIAAAQTGAELRGEN